ncbi:hypothetical protein [Streptomyces sp. NPDC060001]|uniref:hypothetical protein n=1 Tax=Streptomyces sp. NPDC060001 TaxID=3347032 RepID=UPI0036B4F25A
MADERGEVYDSSDEHNRDERVETICQGWGACEMAERIVELEDELGADVDGMCTGMHADVAEAHAEVERLTSLVGYWEHRAGESAEEIKRLKRDLRLSEAKVGGAALYVDRVNARVTMLEDVVDAYDGIHGERDRYRLAWLSARRRAADEANFGMEALELKRVEIHRLRDEGRRLRDFANEVKQVHYRCRDGEPDCAERFLKAIYDSMYELWDAEREGRTFVDRVHRRASRGEFDDVTEADEVRKTTHAPRLESVGIEEDGGTVWRLVGSVDGSDVYAAPVGTSAPKVR